MEQPKPQDEHRFLERLVGTWDMVSATGHDPANGSPQWTETVRSVDGLWFIAEGKGRVPGDGMATTMMTLGYDPGAGYYVGTWIGSMMTRLWVYRGWVEADEMTLTLEAEGPSFDNPGRMAVYHDVIAFLGNGRRRFTGSVRQADGSFREFMTSDFKRRE